MNVRSFKMSYAYVFGALFLITSCNLLSAQEKDDDIFELRLDTKSKTSAQKKVNLDISRDKFYNLKDNLRSTLYFNKGNTVKKYGNKKPVRLKIEDLSQISNWDLTNEDTDQVTFLSLTINNQNDINYLSSLVSNVNLSELEYIMINCNFKCKASQLEYQLKNLNSKIRVFYTVLNPS